MVQFHVFEFVVFVLTGKRSCTFRECVTRYGDTFWCLNLGRLVGRHVRIYLYLLLCMIVMFRSFNRYVNIYGCDKFGYDDGKLRNGRCNDPGAWGYIAVAYFVVFIVVGSLVVLNLFIGIHKNGKSMSD